jgi:hypothetical protein
LSFVNVKSVLCRILIYVLLWSAGVAGLIILGTAQPPPDELLDAQKLKVEFQAQRADISVSILPGMSHSEMVTNPDAIRALVAAFP